MKFLLLVAAFAGFCFAQSGPPQAQAPNPPGFKAPAENDEDQQLSLAVGEAGASPVDYIRALEKHLARFPQSHRKNEIERALVRAAIEAKDDKRIILYGERVLAREPNDVQILDKITRALLATDDRAAAERALKYSRHYEELLNEMRTQSPPGHLSQAQWQEEVDKGLGRTIACEARATGNLGKIDEAIALAQKGYDIYPSAEAAREVAKWLVRAGKYRRPSATMPTLSVSPTTGTRTPTGPRTEPRPGTCTAKYTGPKPVWGMFCWKRMTGPRASSLRGASG